jgi:bacillithiol biosynthesis cysteine-adding enzyme BshC
MKSFEIPYSSTNQFSKLVIDYLNEGLELKPFISHFPTLGNFEKQIIEKQNHEINRSVLIEVLKEQNASFSLSEKSKINIDLLLSEDTFTITTGHQLCLFTGPLYFIYKIISAINLSQQLKDKYPTKTFVPIFWMATEDHDFKEINHIHLFGKKIVWNSKQEGAVGRMKLDGFDEVITALKLLLGESENAKKLIVLFENAYLKHDNLADATHYLVNKLFGKYGLVILDGDDKKLKKQFIPIIKKDILESGFVNTIKECSEDLAKDYKAQAFVRDINFFKLSEKRRELIKGEVSENEIKENPEKFSPNVLMRPLYQETILPNIATIGGAAEVAYWMQLKTAFKQEEIPFPILVLRNSAIIVSKKQFQKYTNLGFTIEDIFLQEAQLHKQYILSQVSSEISLEKEKKELEELFSKLLNKTTDKSLQSTIKAEQQKQLNSLQKLEEKLLKSEKKDHETALLQISNLKAKLFPNNSLQERYDNFIPYYLKDWENFIEILKEELNPLATNFVILTLQ